MTDNVISLNGGAIENERRQAFMQTVAAAFDKYVADHGSEPDAIVYILCGLTQTSSIGWDIKGGSADGATTLLSLAAVHMLSEAGARRQEDCS